MAWKTVGKHAFVGVLPAASIGTVKVFNAEGRPPVWSIERSGTGAAIALDQALASQLQSQWREGFGQIDPGTVAAERVQRALQELHAQQRWLACDCRDDVRPVIFVVRLASGRYVLRRSFDHGEHAAHCPFNWEEGAQAGRAILVRTRRRQQGEGVYVPDFLLFRPAPEAGVKAAGEAGMPATQQASSGSALLQRLEWLAGHAGCVEIHPLTRHGVQEQMGLMRECAKSVPLVEGVALADVLWTHAEWLFRGWCSRAALALLRDRWPARLPMQGYLAVLARGVVGNRIDTIDGTITVHGRVELLAEKAPLLALIALRWDTQRNRFDAASACVVARPQRGVVPLASESLRELAGLLQWAVQREERQSQHRFHVRRVFGGDAMQPDFMVTCGDREFAAFLVSSPESLPVKQAAADALVAQGTAAGLYLPTSATEGEGGAGRALARQFFAWAQTL